MENELRSDELDVVADAFEQAAERLCLDISVIDSAEIEILRGIVFFLAGQLRRFGLSIDSDDVPCIAADARALFQIMRPR